MAVTVLSGARWSGGSAALYVCDTEAELPSSGLVAWRDTAFAVDTKREFIADSTTTWLARVPILHNGLLKPPFFDAANLTAVTAFATNTSYFVYLGRVSRPVTTLDLRANVTTQGATITWAELGIMTGAPVLGGNASLTRRGFTSVAATYNSTGRKNTTIALTGVSAGDELWAAFGSQATTPYQVRGGLADDLQSGFYASVAGRISTLGSPVTVTLGSATLVPPWCSAKI